MNITELNQTSEPDIYESGDETRACCLTLDGKSINSGTAESIASWLIAKYRSKLIYNYIDEIFGILPDSDRTAVYDSVLSIISGKYSVEHLEYIKSKITDFFDTENTMNVDGFINFRLKAYRDDLKSIVEECGYDIMACHDIEDMIDVINFLFDVIDIE